MLALTALLRPYKHFGDDILAIGCQAAVVRLALAILLHARRSESDLRRLAFTTDTAADAAYAEAVELDLWEESIAHGLIAAAVTPIVGAVVLAVLQLRMAPHQGYSSRSSSIASRLGLRRRHPAKARARRRRNRRAGCVARRAARVARSRGSLAPPRPVRLPPPAAGRAAGVECQRAVQARSRGDSRLTTPDGGAGTGARRAREVFLPLEAGALAGLAERSPAPPLIVRASSSVTDDMVGEEPSFTPRTVSMAI